MASKKNSKRSKAQKLSWAKREEEKNGVNNPHAATARALGAGVPLQEAKKEYVEVIRALIYREVKEIYSDGFVNETKENYPNTANRVWK